MSRRILAGLGVAFLITACKPEWPREEAIGGKPETLMPCDVGPSGRFVVSSDSVGPFDVATAIMDDVVSSCGSASAVWEPTHEGFGVVARLDYPGVHVAAEQESRDTVAKPLSRVARWEITGDSVYLAGTGLVPATVAGLARALGRGWVEHPDPDGGDGPLAKLCALPNVAFRIKVPVSVTARDWPVDSSPPNEAVRVLGVIVVHQGQSWPNCTRK